MISEKNEMGNSYRDILDSINEHLSVFLKAITSASIILGGGVTFSLYRYSQEENLNLFNVYPSFGSVLPAIIFLEVIIGGLLIISAFGPVILIYVLSRFFYQEEPEEKGQGVSGVILLYLFIVVIPVLVFVFTPLPSSWERGVWCCLGVYSFLISVAIVFLHKKKNVGVFLGPFVLTFITTFFAIVFAFLSVYYFFSIAGSSWGLSVWAALSLSSIVLAIICLFHWDNDRAKLGSSSILMIAFAFPFITPFSANVFESTLSSLGIGGGVVGVYYVHDSNLSKVPDLLIDESCDITNKELHLTKRLSMKWGVGDSIYVSLLGNENEELKQSIALPRNILLPYDLHAGMPKSCKTQRELIEAANREKKGDK